MQLRKDSRVELPLWLAKALTLRHFTAMDTPAEYGEWCVCLCVRVCGPRSLRGSVRGVRLMLCAWS
jgi:hypothetical protein